MSLRTEKYFPSASEASLDLRPRTALRETSGKYFFSAVLPADYIRPSSEMITKLSMYMYTVV